MRSSTTTTPRLTIPAIPRARIRAALDFRSEAHKAAQSAPVPGAYRLRDDAARPDDLQSDTLWFSASAGRVDCPAGRCARCGRDGDEGALVARRDLAVHEHCATCSLCRRYADAGASVWVTVPDHGDVADHLVHVLCLRQLCESTAASQRSLI